MICDVNVQQMCNDMMQAYIAAVLCIYNLLPTLQLSLMVWGLTKFQTTERNWRLLTNIGNGPMELYQTIDNR